MLCLAFAAGNILADRNGNTNLALATKIAASTSFLASGIYNVGGSKYGAFIITALAFSWIGDLLLVWPSKTIFLGGIAAFLLAHAAYACGFLSLKFDLSAFVVALIIWVIVVIFLIRWLWPHLDGPFRYAVLVYMAAITAMVSLAAATTSPLLTSAAAMFAVSDISVARDRFVQHSFANKIWGIPLYYVAQLLFAISIIRPAQ